MQNFKIIEYPNVEPNTYQIDEYGVIKALKTGREIANRLDKDGYKVVNLRSTKKRQQTFKVHRLVAYAYCENDDVELKTQVNHIDENKQNNYFKNLEWCTCSKNINHGMRTIKAMKPRGKTIIVKNISTNDVVKFNSIAEASRFLNICQEDLNRVLKGERKTTGNYTAWFADSPVYNVQPVPIDKIQANAYNPNKVAPSEMNLLYKSILEDKYTMPIVCYYLKDVDKYEIVDGFHRYTTMLNHKDIYDRENGCLPVVVIDKDLSNRMASTIRHNRARGTHSIELMTNIVADLVDSGMSDQWIMKNIGMEAEELLRLKQISGLASLFKDKDFSKGWE